MNRSLPAVATVTLVVTACTGGAAPRDGGLDAHDGGTAADTSARPDAGDVTDADARPIDGGVDVVADTSPVVDPSYFRVIHYGAMGDGVHDDRPAIQAAMDAARPANGTVYFDPGTYLLVSSTAPGDHLLETDFGSGFVPNLLGYRARSSPPQRRRRWCTPRGAGTTATSVG